MLPAPEKALALFADDKTSRLAHRDYIAMCAEELFLGFVQNFRKEQVNALDTWNFYILRRCRSNR